MNILIVDDSRAMRSIIARALREMGVPGSPYLEAENGRAALQKLGETNVGLVISDLNMPEMSGMELLKSLTEKGIETAFGFVTSEASTQLRSEAAEAGARFVLTKPFTPANLSLTLGPVLSGLGCRTDSVESDPVALANTARFPKAPEVAATLKELLRRGVNAAPSPPVLRPRDGWIVAEYEWAEDRSVVAYVVSDIAFAVRVGAALTMIPSGAAGEAIRSRTLEDTVADNFREVLNVMGRFFDHGGSSRVHLGKVHRSGTEAGPEFASRSLKPTARLDIGVDIAGYGKGLVTLLSIEKPAVAKPPH